STLCEFAIWRGVSIRAGRRLLLGAGYEVHDGARLVEDRRCRRFTLTDPGPLAALGAGSAPGGSLQRHLDPFLSRRRADVRVPLDQPGAGIPPENRVVVPRGAHALRLLERRRDAILGQPLELEHGHAPSILRIARIGSYALSATRSFSGIIALSVMVICSGHTLVQHLVMLHNPMACSRRSASVRS